MTGPKIDPAEVTAAARECFAVSEGVHGEIREIDEAVNIPVNWTGQTRAAVLRQVDTQRGILVELARLVDDGSQALERVGFSFSDLDSGAAAGVGGVEPDASQAAPATPQPARALRGDLNFTV